MCTYQFRDFKCGHRSDKAERVRECSEHIKNGHCKPRLQPRDTIKDNDPCQACKNGERSRKRRQNLSPPRFNRAKTMEAPRTPPSKGTGDRDVKREGRDD